MHLRVAMMESVKHVVSSIGSGASGFARSVGDSTVDLAKRFGGDTADLAKRLGGNTADLARTVGPKRAILGLAVLAAAVGGGIYLSRYLKARAAGAMDEGELGETPSALDRKRSRARNKAAAAHVMH